MREILLMLLQTFITVAVPVLSAYLMRYMSAKATQAANAVQSQLADKYIGEASNAVTTAVLCVSQTYVDALKKSGSFTSENQQEALTKALTQAKGLLTAEATNFVTMAYGDLNKYLAARIEAEVKALSDRRIYEA